jgi:hypothetical protein
MHLYKGSYQTSSYIVNSLLIKSSDIIIYLAYLKRLYLLRGKELTSPVCGKACVVNETCWGKSWVGKAPGVSSMEADKRLKIDLEKTT